jgi:hypothetical protein
MVMGGPTHLHKGVDDELLLRMAICVAIRDAIAIGCRHFGYEVVIPDRDRLQFLRVLNFQRSSTAELAIIAAPRSRWKPHS